MTLASCATMVNGTTQVIPVTSSPPGARASIDSIPVGVTPLLATVSRKQSHLVSITHDSFPAVHIALERHVSPWVLGSLLLYGVPTLYDFSSGGAYEFPSQLESSNLQNDIVKLQVQRVQFYYYHLAL